MKHKNYESKQNETIWTMEQFENWLIENKQDPREIEEKIKKRIAFSGLWQKEFVGKGNRKLHENKF